MIFISFNNRNDNCGDRLIYEKLRAELNKHVKTLPYKSTPLGYKEEALRFRQIFLIALKKRIFSGKISIIFDSPGARFKPKILQKKSHLKKFKKMMERTAWGIIGGKYMVTGISVDETVLIENYTHYHSIGVRDSFSLNFLKDKNLPANYCPDMSFLQKPSMQMQFKKSALLSFRSKLPDNDYDKNMQVDLETSITNVIRVLRDKGFQATFFSQVSEDNEFNSRLAKLHNCEYIEHDPTDTSIKSIYEQYGVTVSNRLHVLLPAAYSGSLPFGLVSNEQKKILSLFETVGLDEYISGIENSELFEKIFLNKIKDFETEKLKIFNLFSIQYKDCRNFIASMVKD